MSKMIFVNLPVKDLKRSIAFYEAVGATKNEQFSNEQAAMMVFSDTISIMLMTHDCYLGFSPKPIADARVCSQVLISLSEESREAVDATVERATAAGGLPDPSPKDEHGFMYGRSFEDPDGHLFGILWMDAAAAAEAMKHAA